MKYAVENNEIELDTSGTECPIPVLKARKLTQTVSKGTIIKVIATDHGMKKEIVGGEWTGDYVKDIRYKRAVVDKDSAGQTRGSAAGDGGRGAGDGNGGGGTLWHRW